MFEIPVGHGLFATVDDVDMDLALCHSWSLVFKKDGRLGRIQATVRGKHVYLNRVIAERMGFDLSFETDHKDVNPLNNRRENLRSATFSQNQANKYAQTNNKLGIKGVRLSRGKYEVELAGKYVGRFDSVEEAAEAYRKAAILKYGEFART